MRNLLFFGLLLFTAAGSSFQPCNGNLISLPSERGVIDLLADSAADSNSIPLNNSEKEESKENGEKTSSFAQTLTSSRPQVDIDNKEEHKRFRRSAPDDGPATVPKSQKSPKSDTSNKQIQIGQIEPLFALIGLSLLAAQAIFLYKSGQPVISKSGKIKLWDGDVLGPENSQQITDWYSFTHVLHGVIFFAVLSVILPDVSLQPKFLIALATEVVWEAIENSPIVINRYRKTALAQGYFGDSIINSIADSLAMSLGFVLTAILPPPVIIGLVIFEELMLAYLIHDNLTLNVIQLIYPLDSISKWQADINKRTT